MELCTLLHLAQPKTLQPCLMFMGKARSQPLSGTPKRCFTRVALVLHPKIRLDLKGVSVTNTLA